MKYGSKARFGLMSLIKLMLLGGVFMAAAYFVFSLRPRGRVARQIALPLENKPVLTRREQRVEARVKAREARRRAAIARSQRKALVREGRALVALHKQEQKLQAKAERRLVKYYHRLQKTQARESRKLAALARRSEKAQALAASKQEKSTRRERRAEARVARKLAAPPYRRGASRFVSLVVVAVAMLVSGVAANGGFTSGEISDFERAQTTLVAAVHPPGSITIIKAVPDEHAQTFDFTGSGDGIDPATFTLADDGAGPGESQQQYTLLTANGVLARSISEDGPLPFGWSLDSISCSSNQDTTSVTYQPSGMSTFQTGDTGVTIVLREDEDVTCTFNNVQVAKTFLVYKDFDDDNGTINVPMTLQCGANPGDATETTVDGDANDNGTTPDAAEFSVTGYASDLICTATETEPSGYTATATTCQANLSAGQCTITNNLNSATFTVQKAYSPVESAQTPNPGPVQISVTCTAGNVITSNPQSADDPTPDAVFTVNGVEGSTQCTATEAPVPGYTSDQGTSCFQIVVSENQQNAGCTITNTANPGTLVIVKNTGDETENDTFSFTGTGTGVSANFTITTVGGTGSQSFSNIAVGGKSVTESGPPAGWDFVSVACVTTTPVSNLSSYSYLSQTASVTLGAGDTVTCTFTNEAEDDDVDAAIAKCGNPADYEAPVFVAAGADHTSGNTNDIIVGGGNNDIQAGAGDNCVIILSGGPNSVTAGTGDDIVITGSGDDTINIGAGDNVVESGGGTNNITTGNNADVICTGTFGTFSDITTCSGGAGNDTVQAGAGHNQINAGNGTNNVTSGNNQDEIWTGTGSDDIDAGAGDNTIQSGGGGDEITTNNNDDIICTSTFGTFGDINTCAGSPDNDVIQAGSGFNRIKAGGGTNSVTSGNGIDHIWTGSSTDTISAGDGANIIESGGGGDNITSGNGDDTICTSTFGTFGTIGTCAGAAQNDVIVAGDGLNRIKAGDGTNNVTAGNGNDEIWTGSGVDTIGAGAGANVIEAGSGGGSITSAGGNDTICTGVFGTFGNIATCTGGEGVDSVNAGTGNNTIETGPGNDTITTGNGTDVIDCGTDMDDANPGTGTNTNVGGSCEDFTG